MKLFVEQLNYLQCFLVWELGHKQQKKKDIHLIFVANNGIAYRKQG